MHVVERMQEFKAVERLALDGGEHGAREFVALERVFVQTFAEDEKLRSGVDEDVVEFGIDVQGLVRGNRPGGRRPDHREAGLFKFHAEDRFDTFLLVFGEFEATSIVGLVLSLYSTSASASADWQSKHQFTGLRPR